MVNNVEKYFKNSLNIGNAFQRNNANGNNTNGNNNNAYGIISFLKGNIFYFVLFIFVVFNLWVCFFYSINKNEAIKNIFLFMIIPIFISL